MVFQHANLVKRRSVLANVLCGTLGRNRNVATALGVLPPREVPHAMALPRRCRITASSQPSAPARCRAGRRNARPSHARSPSARSPSSPTSQSRASIPTPPEIMRLLSTLAVEEGLAVLCVLHQPDLGGRYADRIVGLREGAWRSTRPARYAEERSTPSTRT